MEFIKPNLVESNVKYFLNGTLQNCKKFKEQNINLVYNVSLGIGFFVILSMILYFNYKGNKSAKEIRLKKMRDKEYIMTKLIKIKQDDRKMNNKMLTNLPNFDTHPEMFVLQNKKYTDSINEQLS